MLLVIICLSVTDELKLFQIVVTWMKWWEMPEYQYGFLGECESISEESQGLAVKKGCHSSAL